VKNKIKNSLKLKIYLDGQSFRFVVEGCLMISLLDSILGGMVNGAQENRWRPCNLIKFYLAQLNLLSHDLIQENFNSTSS
jgi:hypothetical protein